MENQPDNTVTPITHLGIDAASKMLGSMTCPSGDTRSAILRIQDKAQAWMDRVKNAKLSQRNLWFLLDHQFLPSIGFGCCTIAADFMTISRALHRQYYQLLPLGGIRRSVKQEVRYLGKGFFGSSCPHMGVECFVGQLEKLLTHYGTNTVVGNLLQLSMELLIIELGLSDQPLAENYSVGAQWVVHSWLRSVWEKIYLFQLNVTIGNMEISLPCEGDNWLMNTFLDMGYLQPQMVKLNRV